MAGKIAIIRNGKIVYDVEPQQVKPNETAARENREQMKTNNRKALLQRNEADYYKAYPEQAKNLSDGLRRRFS